MTLTLEEYAQQKRDEGIKIPAKINQRWQGRVVAQGLHNQGAAGATQYLAQYGRGIKSPKVICLALKAEAEGYPEMADGFWRKAYEIELGESPPDGGSGTPLAPIGEKIHVDGLPADLQPGAIVTMQPVDTDRTRDGLIEDPRYFAQPKRDGEKRVCIATPRAVYHQSRQMKLWPAPDVAVDDHLKVAAGQFGVFVVEGEVVFHDVEGAEWRTSAAAAEANRLKGHPDVYPIPRYCVFKALYVDGDDLRNQPESVRIDKAEPIVRWLVDRDSQRFELVPTARTEDEKRGLVALQEEEGREGEVWVAHDCRYVGGKQNGATAPYLRTKHAVPLEVIVLDLTPSKADGRHFASAEVGVYDGQEIVSLGCVGSGFSQDDQAKLARLHNETPKRVVITIKTRGFTHLGKIQHASFEDFSDTAPEACRR